MSSAEEHIIQTKASCADHVQKELASLDLQLEVRSEPSADVDALNTPTDIDKNINKASNDEMAKEKDYLKEVAATEKELLNEELKCLHCPFTWCNKTDKKAGKTIADFKECLRVLDVEEIDNYSVKEVEEFQWDRFICNLVLCYEHYNSGNLSEAKVKVHESERLIDCCESITFFQKIKEAMLHVVNACKCYVYVALKESYTELKQNVPMHEDMDNINKAAIFGIQAAVLMKYDFEGHKAALECAKRAVDLDGTEGEWAFLYGKVLSKIRRDENYSDSLQKEFSAFDKAVALGKNAWRVVYLARAYREAASRRFRTDRNKTERDKMMETSKELYCEALQLRPNNCKLVTKCAGGLYKLPETEYNLQKAKECIDKALKINPQDPTADHIAGKIYERLGQLDLAEQCYKKAGELQVYGALMDLMRLRFNMDKQYDPVPILEDMLQQYKKSIKIQEIAGYIGLYYCLVKEDILTSIQYFKKAIEQDPDANKLKSFTCSILNMKKPVMLYQLVVDHIQLSLKQRSFGESEVEELKKMLHYCTDKYPELRDKKPRSWKLPNVQRKVQEENHGNYYRNRNNDHGQREPRRDRPGKSSFSKCTNDRMRNGDESFKRSENWRSGGSEKQQSHSQARCSWRTKE